VEALAFVNKWLHLTSMIGLLGGMAFAWLVLRPAGSYNEVVADECLSRLWRAFGMATGILWVIALATGFLNYYLILPTVSGRYHMMAGIKILVVLAMFAASLLAHPRTPVSQRGIRRYVLGALVVAGICVVGLSAQMNISRVQGWGLKAAPTSSVAE